MSAMVGRIRHAGENSTDALRAVRACLTTIGWEPEARSGWTLDVDLESDETAVCGVTAEILADAERFLFYVRFRDAAPPELRAEVAEFVTRANAGLVIGNFELHFDAGALRFKSSLDFTAVELSELLIRNAIVSAMGAVEHYTPYLLAVIAGELSARDAHEAAERALEDEPEAYDA